MKKTKTVIRKIGRDARNGRIISLDEARKRPSTTTVETRKFKYHLK